MTRSTLSEQNRERAGQSTDLPWVVGTVEAQEMFRRPGGSASMSRTRPFGAGG